MENLSQIHLIPKFQLLFLIKIMEATSLSGVFSYTKLCGSSLCYSDDRFSRRIASFSRHSSNGFNGVNKPSSKALIKGPFLSDGLIQRRNLHLQVICRVGVYTLGENDVVESHHSHAMEEKIGVLLLNLGGPKTLKDVQPFLYNLFVDLDIIRLPRLFKLLQRPLAKLISVLRAPKSEEGYAAIGGGSPLRKITDEQENALRMALEAKNVNVSVYVGMRYWYPFTEEVIEQVDTLLDGIKWDDKGLAVAIAQNVDTGAILMQGFVNRGALATTITSRKATFFSRPRATLWTKGETSNNFINIYDKRRNKLCVQFSWRGFLLGHVRLLLVKLLEIQEQIGSSNIKMSNLVLI
ncbi:ferrochelatase-1, chloroplastic isoform X2 [Gossypium hirsutum]|uniref:phosphoribosyl-AMP cyclohydrolase n=1 Tax=Gossypium hirsutum TaxID=3635 RepID=A0ABM2ZIJ5_GOSHI|nr:ferrochelatase-1, chloroplastic-like isoform X2 [Gossypium hirsutum]